MTLCAAKPGRPQRPDRTAVRERINVRLPVCLVLVLRQRAADRSLTITQAIEEAAGLWIAYQRVFREEKES